MTDVSLCSVCRTFLRADAIELGMCGQCDLIVNPPKPCACGHDPSEHHHGQCWFSRWDYASKNRIGCGCTTFEEKAA